MYQNTTRNIKRDLKKKGHFCVDLHLFDGGLWERWEPPCLVFPSFSFYFPLPLPPPSLSISFVWCSFTHQRSTLFRDSSIRTARANRAMLNHAYRFADT